MHNKHIFYLLEIRYISINFECLFLIVSHFITSDNAQDVKGFTFYKMFIILQASRCNFSLINVSHRINKSTNTKNIQPIKLYCQAVKMSRQKHFICTSLTHKHACGTSSYYHHWNVIFFDTRIVFRAHR